VAGHARLLPIRRRSAIAGSSLALLAGVAGLVSQVLLLARLSGLWYCGFAVYLVSTAVAVAALRRIDRLVVLGLLQGAWWIALSFAAGDVVVYSIEHVYGITGPPLAGFWVQTASDVLGVGAAVLLSVAWSPAVAWRRAPRLSPLAVMLVCGVALAQIGVLIATFHQQGANAVGDTAGIAQLVVGLAVTWYAVNLPDSALGGAVVVGWSAVSVLWFFDSMSPLTVSGVVGFMLLAAVLLLLGLAYMHEGTLETPPSRLGSPLGEPAQASDRQDGGDQPVVDLG
jgi:hypothetical protein